MTFDNCNGDDNNYNDNDSKKYDGENNNNNNKTRKMWNSDCVERLRKVSYMCYQAAVRFRRQNIFSDMMRPLFATMLFALTEYDNFPTCCCLEYLAFLDDPEEPVDKGLILIANISTFDIIIRNTTAYHVLKRVHQLLPSTRSYNWSVHQPFHFALWVLKMKLKGEKWGKHFVTEDLPQSCKNDLVLLAARHMAKTPYINYCDPVAVRSPRGKIDHASEVYVPCSFQTDLWFYLRSV